MRKKVRKDNASIQRVTISAPMPYENQAVWDDRWFSFPFEVETMKRVAPDLDIVHLADALADGMRRAGYRGVRVDITRKVCKTSTEVR